MERTASGADRRRRPVPEQGRSLLPLVEEDILDWPGFWGKVMQEARDAEPSPGERIWEVLSDEAQTMLEHAASEGKLPKRERRTIMKALNKGLRRKDFYHERYFSTVALSSSDTAMLEARWSTLARSETRAFNRALLMACYPGEVADEPMKHSPMWRKLRLESNCVGPRDWWFFGVIWLIIWPCIHCFSHPCPKCGRSFHWSDLALVLWLFGLMVCVSSWHAVREYRRLTAKVDRLEERLAGLDE